MPQFRFIHTADIHLDSPVRGLTGYEGPVAERIRTATRQALENLVGEAIEQAVDFLVIAGDLYDGDWRDYQTGLFFVRQMGRLANARIPVYLLHGNHDAESQITKRLTLPPGVFTFSSRKPETFQIKELGVALHGQSFQHRDVKENLARFYPDPVKGSFNIGVLHTGLGGLGGHENYAPCSMDDLVNKGYDYWALGHVHQQAILHERPHVVFCGNLQGRHVRESGSKGAFLVAVAEDIVTGLTALHTDVVRWRILRIPLEGCDRYPDAVGRIRREIEGASAKESDGCLLALRIELTGRTPIHDRLLVSTEDLLAEARAAALSLGDETAWIERVLVSTEAALDAQAVAAWEDAVGDLQRMLDDAASDPDLLQKLESDIGELVRKLPPDVRGEPEDVALATAVHADYPDLITQVRGYLHARLVSRED